MSESDLVLVAPDGDAVLCVQDDSCEVRIKLRVKTLLLRSSSPVFETLFGPKFAEGQQLDAHLPPEISLTDDPGSMKIICQVIHYQTSNLPQHLCGRQVLQLARTVDKYDMLDAMSLAIDRWLVPSKDIDDLHMLMEAAKLLKHKTGFENITRELLMVGKAPSVDETNNTNIRDEDVIDSYILEQRRAAFRTQINQIIFFEALSIGGGCRCSWATKFAFSSLTNYRDHGLDPEGVARMSLAEVIEKLESMTDPVAPSSDEERACERSRRHTSCADIRRLRQAALSKLKEFPGLLLHSHS